VEQGIVTALRWKKSTRESLTNERLGHLRQMEGENDKEKERGQKKTRPNRGDLTCPRKNRSLRREPRRDVLLDPQKNSYSRKKHNIKKKKTDRYETKKTKKNLTKETTNIQIIQQPYEERQIQHPLYTKNTIQKKKETRRKHCINTIQKEQKRKITGQGMSRRHTQGEE